MQTVNSGGIMPFGFQYLEPVHNISEKAKITFSELNLDKKNDLNDSIGVTKANSDRRDSWSE